MHIHLYEEQINFFARANFFVKLSLLDLTPNPLPPTLLESAKLSNNSLKGDGSYPPILILIDYKN